MCNVFQEWLGPINKACFACDYFWNLFVINTWFQVVTQSFLSYVRYKVYIVIFQTIFHILRIIKFILGFLTSFSISRMCAPV